MERKRYLEMCLEASRLENDVFEIKCSVPTKLQVKHRGICYYPYGYKMRFVNGSILHIAIVHELKRNAVHSVKLEDVEEYYGGNGDC